MSCRRSSCSPSCCGVWQIAFSETGLEPAAALRGLGESRDLIVDPFFEYGPQDIGLGWRVLVSLSASPTGSAWPPYWECCSAR